MNYCAPCTLRAYRRTWGLSQRELAEILGFASRTQVSRLEHGKRIPGLETALACSTLFGVSLDDLFPQFVAEIEEKLREKITRLREGSLHTTSVSDLRKRELLDRALSGANDEPYPGSV